MVKTDVVNLSLCFVDSTTTIFSPAQGIYLQGALPLFMDTGRKPVGQHWKYSNNYFGGQVHPGASCLKC